MNNLPKIEIPSLALNELAKLYSGGVKLWDKDLHDVEKYDWVADNRPCLLVPLVKTENFIGCADVGKGRDLLWDGQVWHTDKYGIFLDNVVFVTDY